MSNDPTSCAIHTAELLTKLVVKTASASSSNPRQALMALAMVSWNVIMTVIAIGCDDDFNPDDGSVGADTLQMVHDVYEIAVVNLSAGNGTVDGEKSANRLPAELVHIACKTIISGLEAGIEQANLNGTQN